MVTPRWSALMLDGQLPKMADDISISMILTPVKQLVTVRPDETLQEAAVKMQATFDQLPVLAGNSLVGMLFRGVINSPVEENGLVRDYFIESSKLASIRSNEGIWDAVKLLSDHEVSVVFEPERGGFSGLLHFADLNRQAVRIYCYLWTSALEMSMAELLVGCLPDPNQWIGALPEHRQVQVLGRYEYGRRQKMELSPVEGLELSDLVNLWPRHPKLLEVFGISKKQFESRANPLIKLRNAAMHPVRSLVNSHSEVKSLAKKIHDLKCLVESTLHVLKDFTA